MLDVCCGTILCCCNVCCGTILCCCNVSYEIPSVSAGNVPIEMWHWLLQLWQNS
jgi:hypothetical protein